MKKMLVLLAVLAVGSSAFANFTASVLDNGVLQGSIEARYTDSSAASYYNFNNWNFNGPWPILSQDRSHIFIMDNNEGSSVFVVLDQRGSNGGGRADMTIKSNYDFSVIVADDTGGNDHYNTVSNQEFHADFHWVDGHTDGLALQLSDDAVNAGDWYLDIITENTTSLNSWGAYSDDETVYTGTLTDPSTITLTNATLPSANPTVPAPGAILLSSLGTALVGWLRRR